MYDDMDSLHLYSAIMQHQHVMKYIDPDFSKSVDEMCKELHSVSKEYYNVVV